MAHDRLPKWIRNPVGKRNGSWFVRIPLWLQGTILIFSTGFISLLILTIVAGFKTWQYSESLMRERLSNFAAMTALQVEENFGEIQNRLASASSSQSLLSLLAAINLQDTSAYTWQWLEEQFEIQFNGFTDLHGLILYDKEFRIVYSQVRRDKNKARPQLSLLPHTLIPLSDPDQRDGVVAQINNYTSGVLSSQILPQWDNEYKSSVNFTYTVSRGISKYAGDMFSPTSSNTWFTTRNNTDWVGYCTFLLNTPYAFTANMTSSNLFESYQAVMVQENKVGLKDFTFLVPFHDSLYNLDDRLTWPVKDFPVVVDAINLVDDFFRVRNGSSANSNSTQGSNSTSGDDNDNGNGNGNGNTIEDGEYDNKHRLYQGDLLRRHEDSAARYNKANLAIFEPGKTAREEAAGKQGRAVMRTRAPWQPKSSIGYSWANVLNQEWLIFVQITQSEAFSPAVHLRKIVIGVGVGILGAVVIIMTPLSRWQTRGLYIIYQNMRLRPMFVLYEEGDHEEGSAENLGNDDEYEKDDRVSDRGDNDDDDSGGGGGGGSSQGKGVDRVAQKTRNQHSKEAVRPSGIIEATREPSDSSKSPESLNSSDIYHESLKDNGNRCVSESPGPMISRADSEGAHGRVPTSLPPLNRFYTDELDDLIYEYNNMVDKLNNQYLHLEDEVRLRTREAQLARELTEQANHAKSEFIAIISHELRTPLNGIMGLTSVSVEDDDITNIKTSLALIIESGRVLMGLLNELLELSKSLVGVEPSVRLFSPTTILESLPNMFQSRTPDLSVTFSLAAVPSDLTNVTLRGDVDHVIQVCLNFMSNAMKFSEKNGSVSVILHLRPLRDHYITTEPYGGTLDNANSILEILVTDSGVGMSPAQLAKIFDLFVQGDDPLRKNHHGAGLGMALSKQLAEGIGGYVAVFSAEGVGSSVVLRVPVECVGKTAHEVNALNGPPIEFKVHDVYTTLSLDAGNVMLVKNVHHYNQLTDGRPSTGSAPVNTRNYPPSPSARRSRHSYHSSSGSKMLLTRAHPVTKLLRTQHQQPSHQHQPSHSTAFASLHSGGSTAESASDSRGELMSPMDVITGRHKSDSSSSLLLVLPPAVEEQNSHRISRGSWHNSDHSPTPPPMTSREPSPKRKNSGLALTAVPSFRSSSMGAEGILKPEVVSPADTTGSGPPVVFVTSGEGSSVITEVDGRAKILVVEDNPLNRQIMVKMLKQLGLEDVITASNGEEAVKLVETSIVGGYHYAVIFMDISMPVMNGLEATHFIRVTLGYTYPIVALTGFTDAQSRSTIMASNVQEVLSKPVMRNDIARVLDKYAGKTKGSS